MLSRCTLVLALLAGAASSATAQADTAHGPHVVEIAAPVNRTWDTLVSLLATKWQFTTKTVNKESGLLETDAMAMQSWNRRQKEWASPCASLLWTAAFTFLVRGDSTHSAVTITPIFTGWNNAYRNAYPCESTHRWEGQLGTDLKTAAEARVRK
ncbi:MAG TPA: hypothetical protein VH539_10365 [Gemmatimonadaceae bacterium]|jgi:hypothetical protein